MFHGEYHNLEARIRNAHRGQLAGIETSLQQMGAPDDPQLEKLRGLLAQRRAKLHSA